MSTVATIEPNSDSDKQAKTHCPYEKILATKWIRQQITSVLPAKEYPREMWT